MIMPLDVVEFRETENIKDNKKWIEIKLIDMSDNLILYVLCYMIVSITPFTQTIVVLNGGQIKSNVKQ